MSWLKQNTATVVQFGSAVIGTTGGTLVSPTTSLGSTTVDELGVYKAGSTTLTSLAGSTTFQHLGGGEYSISLSSGTLNTLGPLRLKCRDDSACLPFWRDFLVVPANAYDALVAGSTTLAADATLIEGVDATNQITAAVTASTLLVLVENQTDDIGAAGAGLSAIPWSSAWDAEVQSEVNDALVALGLDHLVNSSVAGADVADNSIVAKMVASGATADWDTYASTTDSLQAIRDTPPLGTAMRGTDSAYTGTPPTTADIEASANAAIVTYGLDHLLQTSVTSTEIANDSIIAQIASKSTAAAAWSSFDNTSDSLEALRDVAPHGTAMRGTDSAYTGTPPTTAQIADAVWDEAKSGHVTAGSFGEEVQAHALSSELLTSTGVLSTGDLVNVVVAYGLDHLLATSVSSSDVANDSVLAQVVSSSTAAAWSSYDNESDSLQAIRDVAPHGTAMRGTDSAYTGTPPTTAEIADAVWDEAKSGHTAVGSFGEEIQAHALSTELLSTGDAKTAASVALTSYDPPTHTELQALLPSTAQLVLWKAGLDAMQKITPSTATHTSTAFTSTSLTEVTDDHYIGRVFLFTGGALRYQGAAIADYAGSTGGGGTLFFSTGELTEAPTTATPGVIV